MEVEKNGRKLKEENHNHNHLSGAYIRRLVKQLSSSKTKDSKSSSSCTDGYYSKQQQLTSSSSKVGVNDDDDDEGRRQAIISQQQEPQQQHKKQVRRRLHTSRPYQERLLNMAEARREIVTALKFHRAAHSQQKKQQQQQQQHDHDHPINHQKQQQKQYEKQQPPPDQRFSSSCHLEQNHLSYSTRTTTTTTTFPNLYSGPCPWSAPPPPPPPPTTTTLNINDQNLVIASPLTQLPDQTLGLNLNFHDFDYNLIKLDTTTTTTFPTPNYYYISSSNSSSSSSSNSSNPSSSSSPISSSSSSYSYSVATHHQEFPASYGLPRVSDIEQGGGDGGLEVLHATLDDEEMANIRSIGEQHQMEWNDTLNLVTSAWWFKFFKKADEDDHDEAMEFQFPDWLSTANDYSCGFQQQHFNDHYSHDYFQDPAPLPCMEIGEIEEMDEEWLA